MAAKRCPRCGRTLPASEFSVDRSRRDGLSVYCFVCRKEYNIRHADEGAARRRERMRSDPAYRERVLAYHREYNRRYRERLKKG